MKRVVDLLIAGSAVLMLAPLLLLISIAIKLLSPGPILFSQERVGLGCRPFRMYKFRSMVVDAERIGGHSTNRGDPRITPIGHILRRTSLDELPQLFNVLAGDMSLVGPRPDVPAQRSIYTAEEWELRHRVRPGITGAAQATSRSDATIEQRKELDLTYVRTATMRTDLVIMWRTVIQVVSRGSH